MIDTFFNVDNRAKKVSSYSVIWSDSENIIPELLRNDRESNYRCADRSELRIVFSLKEWQEICSLLLSYVPPST